MTEQTQATAEARDAKIRQEAIEECLQALDDAEGDFQYAECRINSLLQKTTSNTSNHVTTENEYAIYKQIVEALKVASVDKEKRQVMVVGYVSGDTFAQLANIGQEPVPVVQ